MPDCIFYLPYKLEMHGRGARMLRPRKMIQAFREIGYNVFVITGHSSERKERIEELKSSIKKGVKYDFMYTESSTMPTLLTDPHHFPLHPFFDFEFFKYLQRHGIRIGLFYCDIYWKFDSYGARLPWWKKRAALLCYEHDIENYKKYLSKFYLPDLKALDYINEKVLSDIASELPPGADSLTVDRDERAVRDFTERPLRIFYVGGLGKQYQITELVKAVYNVKETELTICCRAFEWERVKDDFSEWLCDRITVVHKNSDELEPFYEKADLCSLMFKPGKYRDMAKPFKAYEYLAHEIPIIATGSTAIGKFVEEAGIGWSIDFSAEAIERVFREIIREPELLDRVRNHCIKAKNDNLWICRARQVAEDLKCSLK